MDDDKRIAATLNCPASGSPASSSPSGPGPASPRPTSVSSACSRTAPSRSWKVIPVWACSNPSFALGHTALGWGLLRAGWFNEAIAEQEWALRPSPVGSFWGLHTSIHAPALPGAGRIREALPFLRQSAAALDACQGHSNQIVSCCGHLGPIEGTQDFLAASHRSGPRLTLKALRAGLAKFARRNGFVERLRKAGIPEK